MESRVSRSLKRSTRETWSVWERASVRTTKSKSAAVKRARQFARIIGNSLCARTASMASQIDNQSGARYVRVEPATDVDLSGRVARNLPRLEYAARHRAHRPRPNCRVARADVKQISCPHLIVAPVSSGTRRKRTQPGRHVPLRIKW